MIAWPCKQRGERAARGYSLDPVVWGWADVTIGSSQHSGGSSGVGCNAGLGLASLLLAAGAAIALRRKRG